VVGASCTLNIYPLSTRLVTTWIHNTCQSHWNTHTHIYQIAQKFPQELCTDNMTMSAVTTLWELLKTCQTIPVITNSSDKLPQLTLVSVVFLDNSKEVMALQADQHWQMDWSMWTRYYNHRVWVNPSLSGITRNVTL
jgi:hypothetical protein